MSFTRLVTLILLALLAVSPSYASVDQITATTAQETANSFIKSRGWTSAASLKAPAMADIVLAHAEPSDMVERANVYYIFNIKGGGFIIVSGEGHAAPVLGYSDKGQIDINHMSEPLKGILDGFKAEIEYLLSHDVGAAQTVKQSFKTPSTVVEPMTKSTWGPEEPYNNQCPTYFGVSTKAGCVGVFMSQIMSFWQFPHSCDSLPAYWSARLRADVPALPPTVFDYRKILDSYAHWSFDNDQVVLDDFTDEQEQEVAKLVRYCGQSVQMDYSPTISTPNGVVLDVMKQFGYNPDARRLDRVDYDQDEWIELMQQELDAGRPIMYTAYGPGAASVGHAFIVDGYDINNYFHMNMGWYGVNDGWYLLSAIRFINRDHQSITYDRSITMLVGMEPPLFCTVDTEINACDSLMVLGGSLSIQAVDVNLSMSYRTLPFMFSLTDAQGQVVAVSEAATLDRLAFDQGSDISLALTLPEDLPEGMYDLHLNYRADDGGPLMPVATANGHLMVVGRLAKYGRPFDIGDVILAIDHLIFKTPGVDVRIGDVVSLIDYILN